ncbi:amidohydrolase [Dehalobacter restrictus]|uniref:N-acyl-L-amino acid amidohydrolase n=1 Tax=Dehalobacter restrictus (strain DSM 9455 / PER-K23) TaxID=871738 RepID=A0ABM5P5I2_DEHRP|nr:amidohydrolase [Dehalobacter restrictus]AHF09872.1 N-acyl-L-amino acid amidohydrolase [Dehalobacter restrictus DSM 9455]
MPENERITAISGLIAERNEEIINLRRTFHRYPELSFQEYHTADMIFDRLHEVPGIEVSRPTETSVLAAIKGSMPGKMVALRSDIDALPIQEENDLPYRSQNIGTMHACGHDGHAAMLVGAAKVLAELRSDMKGEIRCIFQHAEEKHPGGAKDLVKLGLLNGVDAILALHLFTSLPAGKIGLASGPLMAAPDNFTISIWGKGGHAAMPEDTIDPVLISAQIVTALQNIVSRQTSALKSVVLSITNIQGGSAFNIIPERVDLKGTVRTFDRDTRLEVPKRMENIIKGICIAYGAKYTFDYELGYDPVVNSSSVVGKVTEILKEEFGAKALVKANPVMWGEDFSAYLHRLPGMLIFIGAGNKKKGISHPHHHPCFNIDEEALSIGTRVLACSALGLLERM